MAVVGEVKGMFSGMDAIVIGVGRIHCYDVDGNIGFGRPLYAILEFGEPVLVDKISCSELGWKS